MFWMGSASITRTIATPMLQNEINQVDVRIAKIKDLEKVRDHLLARKQIIEQLQADRSQMVHLFDELVKTIPASARLTGMKQDGQSMSLDGVAQSNASVAEYMRNIEASSWLGHTDLRKTEKSVEATRMPYTFGLDVALSRPKADDPMIARWRPTQQDARRQLPPRRRSARKSRRWYRFESGGKPNATPADRARLDAMAKALEAAQTKTKSRQRNRYSRRVRRLREGPSHEVPQ
jgi:hypothetical protein